MDHSTFTYPIYIETTVEKLWEALTSADMTQTYFFGRRVVSDWREGWPVAYFRPNGELDVRGCILACEPYKRLSFTWETPNDPTIRARPTEVTFTLVPMEEVVKLVLTHACLTEADYREENEAFAGLNNGWPAILSNLKSLLENGRTFLRAADAPRLRHGD